MNSPTVTRYLNVGSWTAPSIWTRSYFGVTPRRTYSSCSRETGVLAAPGPPPPPVEETSSLSRLVLLVLDTVSLALAGTAAGSPPSTLASAVGMVIYYRSIEQVLFFS